MPQTLPDADQPQRPPASETNQRTQNGPMATYDHTASSCTIVTKPMTRDQPDELSRLGEPGISYPCYVGGEWGCAPEDCGGIPGFYTMLEAQADLDHPDHAEVTEYLDGWNPREIDELPLRIALGRIRRQDKDRQKTS